MPPDVPPGSPPDGSEGVGATAGAGAGAAAGAGVAADGGVVVGVVVVVEPDPEPVAPPEDGTVTGLVGAGAGTGRGSGMGAGALLEEPRDGRVTGDERTGIEGRVRDPSETRSALVTLADDVADGSTTSDVRTAAEDPPGTYEVGRAAVPLLHTELPADGGGAGAGPATAGAGVGVGDEPTGAVLEGAAISPVQSEAEYVFFGWTLFWATGDADAARAVPSPTATTPTVTPWLTRE
jgi:hypothetical protein